MPLPKAVSHIKVVTTRAVKQFCLWCCCDQLEEIKGCPATGCPLHEVRPYTKGRGKSLKRATRKDIRCKCVDCSGAKSARDPAVSKCEFNGKDDVFCPLWPYRMGTSYEKPPK